MSDQVQVALLAALASVIGAVLLYKGATRTSSAAKSSAANTAHVDAQESALKAWQAINQPLVNRVEELTRELAAERKARQDQAQTIEDEQGVQRQQMAKLQSEVTRWQQVAKTIARWATQLRDEVLRLGGSVPATPEELLTLQAIDEASDR